MNLQTIEMPKAEAIRHYREYADAVRQRSSEEDRAIMRGFHALSRGQRILQLSKTVAAGSVDSLGRPRLAVARADARFVELRVETRWVPGRSVGVSGRSVVEEINFWSGPGVPWRYGSARPVSPKRVVVPTFTDVKPQEGDWIAMVPNVPPRLRPRSLRTHHVLFEADWVRPRGRIAPRDPALLRHLGGDLWLLLATWDLTELERAVLAGRA